jgi:hypothetical protein
MQAHVRSGVGSSQSPESLGKEFMGDAPKDEGFRGQAVKRSIMGKVGGSYND